MNLNGVAGFALYILISVAFAVWIEARMRRHTSSFFAEVERWNRDVKDKIAFLQDEKVKHGGGRRWTDRQP